MKERAKLGWLSDLDNWMSSADTEIGKYKFYMWIGDIIKLNLIYF